MLKTYHRLIGAAAIKPVTHDSDNSDTFPLIWLDSSVNTTQENLDAQALIRSSIDHLKTFESAAKCEEYIRSISSDERIILIMSGRLGRELTPRIDQLRQVSAIFIYCLDKSVNEPWAKEYKKIKDIVTKLNELIDRIRSERSKRNQNEVNETFSINMYYQHSNKHFLYWQLLINVLLRLIPINTEKNQLILLCKEKYHGINHELQLIQEFEENYSSDRALDWYMRDSFLYRLLNKALRMRDIDLLFLFRFFIRDIHRAIEQDQCTSPVRVYRSQLMTKEEIDLLQSSTNTLISINSFFSTSIYRELTLQFFNQSSTSNNLERVMFEIDADPSQTSSKPFAFIQSNNSFRQTEEVLFTLGSIFRLTNIHQQTDGMWIVQMMFCSDDDEQLQVIFKPFTRDAKISVTSFGHLLKQMDQLYDAEKFFDRLLNELSHHSYDVADCYYALGCIAMEKKMYDLSLERHLKSLEMKLKLLQEDDLSIANSYNSIGQVYLKKHDYKQTVSAYLRALKITMQAQEEDHPNVAICYTNIGGVYQKQENYPGALECYQTALTIRQKKFSVDHPDLGISYNNVAIIYACLGQYDLASKHYDMALRILQTTLPPLHPEIAVSYCGLGLIYERKDQLETAYSYYEKAAIIYRQTLSATHPDVLQIERYIQRISAEL